MSKNLTAKERKQLKWEIRILRETRKALLHDIHVKRRMLGDFDSK